MPSISDFVALPSFPNEAPSVVAKHTRHATRRETNGLLWSAGSTTQNQAKIDRFLDSSRHFSSSVFGTHWLSEGGNSASIELARRIVLSITAKYPNFEYDAGALLGEIKLLLTLWGTSPIELSYCAEPASGRVKTRTGLQAEVAFSMAVTKRPSRSEFASDYALFAPASAENLCSQVDCRGLVARVRGASVFFAFEGGLHTPINDCFFDDISRRKFIELARQNQIDVFERHIRALDIRFAAGWFLVSRDGQVIGVQIANDHSEFEKMYKLLNRNLAWHKQKSDLAF